MKRDILSSRIFNSRVRSADTQKSEQILGYFIGPCFVYMMYSGVAGIYLTQFYTDILGLAGGFLTLMPLISKALSGIIGIFIGRMIDRTRTSQGKARPWILASGILLSVCGTLLYAVPRASRNVQIVWIVVSYNLFFSLAFAVYSLSHSLMVPLSTRNTKQRDTLAMLTSMGTSMIPGILTMIVMPLLVKRIGVGADAHGSWMSIMSIISIIAIPATLIEYYFTKERVTEEGASNHDKVSFGQQVRACLHDRYWIMIIVFTMLLHLCSSLTSTSMLYYCNWVLGNSVESGAAKQILVNVIGQAPMGFGVAILWPLVRRFGKRKVAIAGFAVAAMGSLIVLLGGGNMAMVLGGLLIKSVGALPTYVMASLLAEALDHIEWKNHFRADGFSASVNSIIQMVVMGLSQTLLLAGIHGFGYIPPQSADQIIAQPDSVRVFFQLCFAGLPMIGYAVCAVIMIFYHLESKMSQISRELADRKKL